MPIPSFSTTVAMELFTNSMLDSRGTRWQSENMDVVKRYRHGGHAYRRIWHWSIPRRNPRIPLPWHWEIQVELSLDDKQCTVPRAEARSSSTLSTTAAAQDIVHSMDGTDSDEHKEVTDSNIMQAFAI